MYLLYADQAGLARYSPALHLFPVFSVRLGSFHRGLSHVYPGAGSTHESVDRVWVSADTGEMYRATHDALAEVSSEGRSLLFSIFFVLSSPSGSSALSRKLLWCRVSRLSVSFLVLHLCFFTQHGPTECYLNKVEVGAHTDERLLDLFAL